MNRLTFVFCVCLKAMENRNKKITKKISIPKRLANKKVLHRKKATRQEPVSNLDGKTKRPRKFISLAKISLPHFEKITLPSLDKLQISSQEKKVFSGLDDLPSGRASDDVINGCMVLEGGAFRGVYTSGVLDALMENNINLETTVGVSAGALNGMGYVSGQIGRCARINLKFRHDSRYIGVNAVKKNMSVVGFDFIFNEINEEIEPFDEERFFKTPRRYIAAATSCETGKPVYFEKGICSDIYQAARASASMQILSKMVEVDGEKCLDGGASKRIPIDFAINEKFDKIIVVRTRDREYRKEEKESKLQATYYRKYPEFAEALLNSNIEYNAECDYCDELERQGKIVQIVPSEIVTVSRLEGDMEKLGALYYLGYNDALNALPKIKEYLGINQEEK